MKRILCATVLLSTLSLFSCATVPASSALDPVPAVIVKAEPFDRYERRLIQSGGPQEVMVIVEDDTPAGNEFLREKALELDPSDPLIGLLSSRMLETVRKAPGVGIAAPQVGISRRAVWVMRKDKENEPFEFYINPHIVEFSPEKASGWEGCLSVPAGFGKVERSQWVVVAYDRSKGEGRVTERIEGFTAVIFQHEIDHLDGVLFIDRKESGDLMPKEAYYEMRRKEREAAGAGGK